MEQEKKPFYKKWWVITLAVFFFVGFLGDLFSEESLSQPVVNNTVTEQTQPVTNTPTPVTSQKVSVGEEGYINAPSPKAVIALTKDGFSEITKIFLANDMMGVGDFLLSGKGFAVTKGTKVLVIESAVGSRKVRILEGDQIGNAGWIAMEWVTKTK